MYVVHRYIGYLVRTESASAGKKLIVRQISDQYWIVFVQIQLLSKVGHVKVQILKRL